MRPDIGRIAHRGGRSLGRARRSQPSPRRQRKRARRRRESRRSPGGPTMTIVHIVDESRFSATGPDLRSDLDDSVAASRDAALPARSRTVSRSARPSAGADRLRDPARARATPSYGAMTNDRSRRGEVGEPAGLYARVTIENDTPRTSRFARRAGPGAGHRSPRARRGGCRTECDRVEVEPAHARSVTEPVPAGFGRCSRRVRVQSPRTVPLPRLTRRVVGP